MPAFADFAAHVRLRPALGTSLLPTLSRGLFDLWLRGSCRAQLQDPRFIRFFQRALGVDSSQWVSRFTANRAQLFRWLRYDHDGLFATHSFSQQMQFLRRNSIAVDRKSSVRRCGTRVKKTGREDVCPAAGGISSSRCRPSGVRTHRHRRRRRHRGRLGRRNRRHRHHRGIPSDALHSP